MLIIQALVMKAYHDMNLDGKIGPALNIAQVYAKSSKPEDFDVAYKANDLRNWLHFDVAVYGKYNNIAWNWLVENNYQPEILMAGKADFIALIITIVLLLKNLLKQVELN